jgi:hypothetical protein
MFCHDLLRKKKADCLTVQCDGKKRIAGFPSGKLRSSEIARGYMTLSGEGKITIWIIYNEIAIRIKGWFEPIIPAHLPEWRGVAKRMG